MPFSFLETSLSDVKLICPQEFKDDRGSFWECFKQSDFILLRHCFNTTLKQDKAIRLR